MALLLSGLLLLSPLDPGSAQVTPPPAEVEDVLEAVDLAAWDDLFSRMEQTESWQRPSALIHKIASGEEDIERFFTWLKNRSLGELNGAVALCVVSLVTGVLGALLETVLDGPSLPARRVLSVGLSAVLLVRLLPLIRRGIGCLRGLSSLAAGLVPLMTGALLLLGSPQGAACLGTVGELLLSGCLRWMEGSLLPLALSAGVLRAADLMGDGVLSVVSRLLFALVRWGIRILCIGYMILAGLMGAGAANMDTLLLRSGKVAAGSLPLVGSIVSDSLGTAAACLGLVKGALGRTGALLVAAQAAGPAGSLFLHGFGLKAASSLLVPLEQREMGTMLSALGEMLIVLGALILAAGAMLCVALGGAAGLLGGSL